MTIICAYKPDALPCIAIGSDTMLTDERGWKDYPGQKWQRGKRVQSVALGTAGSLRLSDIAGEVFREFEGRLGSGLDIRLELASMLRALRTAFQNAGAPGHDREGAAPEYEFDAIIVARSQIWVISPDLSIMPGGQFAAIGTGAQVAMGAFHALKHVNAVSVMRPNAVVQACIRAAMRLSEGCGGEALVEFIENEGG